MNFEKDFNRREFLKGSLIVGSAAVSASLLVPGLLRAEDAASEGKAFNETVDNPTLPYPFKGLEPYISDRTLNVHYLKHYQGYLKKTAKFTEGTEFEKIPLVDTIRATAGKTEHVNIFNNAAQVWNHEFYWKSLQPNAGGKPTGELEKSIITSFGTFEKFKEAFSNAANSQFGSGWAWVVADGTTITIEQTSNADTPIAHGRKAILTIDVWEHAYYLDYQNRRADYVKAIIDNLLNWDFAEMNFKA